MIKIGILGDIGSGKSYIAKNFGYPVFNADKEVGKLYKSNKRIFIKLKNLFNDLEIVDWGEASNFDMIINATSIGLKKGDKLNLDFSKFQSTDFFYDVIYNPKETNFLKDGKNLGKKIENGKKMFIYQAAKAFKIWHGIEPKINEQVIGLLDKW